jgi:serine/threonine protein kinase
MKKSQKNVG